MAIKGAKGAAYITTAGVLWGLLSSIAYGSATVANKQSFSLPFPQANEVPANSYRQFSIPLKPPALLEVQVTVKNAVFNDLNVYICDENSLQRFRQGLANGCRGVTKGRRQISFSYSLQSSSSHYLILDNSYAAFIKKKVAVEVTATIVLPPRAINELRTSLEKAQAEISTKFNVPEFDISLRPCGIVNAFSAHAGGDITLCSELFFELHAEGLKGAVEAILYHELAHTLLNLWGLPNFDNEETADEFALVMLFWRGRQHSALDWIRFYAKADPHDQAAQQIRHGDRHPLSVQRIRNIERILDAPLPVIQRWNRLVYPRMSADGLKKIMNNPGPYQDRSLARKVLSSRTSAE